MAVVTIAVGELGAVLAEATVVDRLVERRATHHAFLKVTLAGSQTGVRTLAPGVQRVLTRGVCHGRLEGTRVHDRGETAHVAEAERGGEAGLDAADVQRLGEPHHVVVALQLRVHAVERGVGRDHAGLEQLCQAVDLEDAGAALRVAGERLLGDHEQRVAVRAADGVRQRVVQLGLVRVVRVGGRVVLGDHGDVVGGDAERGQIVHELRVAAAEASRQGAEARGRDRGVRAIRVRVDEADYAGDRQTHAKRDVTARQQDRAAALGLQEAAAATVVRTREEARVDALRVHLLRVGGGVHVAEADHGFHADVVNRAGDHEVGLAEGDLVGALLQRHRGGGAGGDRLDHVAVAADVGLHHMRGHHVRQGLLQDIGRDLMVEEAVKVQLAHRHHAAEAGSLRARHHRGMDGLQHLGRREAGGQVGVHGGDDVPQRDLVDVADHRGRDAPLERVEALRELAADRARHRGATRHANHRTGVTGDVPFARLRVGRDGGVRLVHLDVFLGDVLGGHGEGDVVVEEDLGLLFVGAVLVVVAHAFIERTDAGAGHDLVMVALGDVLFGHEVAVGVVPTRLRTVLPFDQTHVPREFEHRAGGQVDAAVGVDSELRLEAGAAGAPRAQLADGDDDDLVLGLGGDVLPVGQVDRRLLRHVRAGQRLDAQAGCGGLRGGGVVVRLLCGSRGLLCVGHRLGAQRLDIDRGVAEPAGQVHVERMLDCFRAGFRGAQVEQLHGDLFGGVRVDAVAFDDLDQRVVAAHQAGTAHPANLRVGEGDTRRPYLFGMGAVDDRVKRALDLAVRAVAAKDAAVRGAGQHHMQLVLHVGVGADGG